LGTQTIEEYLETVKSLEEMEGSPVRTSSLARALAVSAASVSEMLQRLSEKGMVRYTPYSGVSLTEKGIQQVLKLTRRHRLWEVFLNKYLGIGWEEVYNEACNLEHNTSELVAKKLAQYLNNPVVCPHGSPIPDINMKIPVINDMSLTDLENQKKVKITRITNEINSELLHHIAGLGLAPGKIIEFVERASFDGTITVKVDNSVRGISAEVASVIKVEYVI
jgi:DtxR family Mn-dependent transcriptional regulator